MIYTLKKYSQLLAILLIGLIIAVNIGLYLYSKNLDENKPQYNIEKINSPISSEGAKLSKGEMMMISIPDKVLSENTINFLNENKIGGVILMGNNIEDDEQLRKLTDDLREKVDKDLLIAIDQEGGLVARIKWEPNANISAREIGESGSTEYAYNIALERGKFLKERGINVVLGPVADISYTNDSFMYSRSFGSDPQKVAEFVRLSVRGYNDAGIISVLKHFPGHGNTEVDSHDSLPTINTSIENLRTTDFLPFKAGLDEGAHMVMVGHIINPQVNPNEPASISKEFLKFMESEIGEDYIVITDDLKMTGQIEGAIGWGINISIEDFDKVLERMNSIEIEEKYMNKIINLKKSTGN